jgi:hypothetical protein
MSVKPIAMRITLATRRTVLISPCSLSDPRVLVERALDTSHLLSEQPHAYCHICERFTPR